jgi:hypothetical protein
VSDWLSLLSAFGVGAVVSALIQTVLSRKIEIQNRNFGEKKEAYVGLLEAYLQAAQFNTDAAAKNFAYWQLRCEIAGSIEVRDAVEALKSSDADRKGRSSAQEKLKAAMRKDLGITSK